MKKNCC